MESLARVEPTVPHFYAQVNANILPPLLHHLDHAFEAIGSELLGIHLLLTVSLIIWKSRVELVGEILDLRLKDPGRRLG